jgi:hypothetical protein
MAKVEKKAPACAFAKRKAQILPENSCIHGQNASFAGLINFWY